MRVIRYSWLVPLTALTVAACTHDDPATVIARDGSNVIAALDMSTGSAGGFLGGTRATNRFVATAFDTSVADAFARSSSSAAMRGVDSNGFGYTSGTRPRPVVCYRAGRNSATDKYLPALASDSAVLTTFYSSIAPVCYIVQAVHPFNGGEFWEFWVDFTKLSRSQQYVLGLARYALDQRGALDIAEILQFGTRAQPDSLVFKAGDFNPGGYLDVTNYGAPCPDPAYNAVAGANPHFVGSDVATAGSGSLELDVTLCGGSVWAADFGAANSPVPNNNSSATLGPNQYNFLVLWEALPGGAPNYAKPVLRVQIGPLPTTAGAVVNNAFAPLPTTALTAAQLALLPAATAQADTIRVTANNLKRLASGAYQLWMVQSGTNNAQLVTGRVVRLRGTTVVDTLSNVSEFNLNANMNAARVEFDFANYATVNWDAATLAVTSAGATTLSDQTPQPLWTSIVTKKAKGAAVPALTSSLTFGTFTKGKSPVVWGAAGAGTGGVFGLELREDVKRVPRPPLGYYYEAWLVSTTDTSKYLNLGPILAPYPDLGSLADADTRTSAPLSGAEITQAAIRYVSANRAFYCTYNRVQMRLAPKSGATNLLSPTLVLSNSAGSLIPGC